MTTEPAADDESSRRNIGSHIFNLVMLAVGGIALWWMIRTLGWDDTMTAVERVGVWFVVVLALDLVALLMDAAALHAFMRPEARMISYLRVLGAQASGRAINVLTPTGALGEATKLTILTGRAPRSRVLSSIVLQNLTQLYLTVTVMVIGTPIVLLLVDLSDSVKVLILIGFAIILPGMIALAILVKRGAVSTLVGVIRRLRIVGEERAGRWKARLVEVDKHIRELQQNRSHGTWKGILWVGASKLVTWTATMILIYTAGVDISAALVIGLMSVGVLIQWVSQIVPMGLGLADGGNYALFSLTGAAGSHGVGITMINRARSLTVAILGLLALAATYGLGHLATMKMRRRLAVLRRKAHDRAEATEAAEQAAAR